MERAAAVVVAGIGLVLLTLAALVFAGPDDDRRPGGVEVAALVTGPSVPYSGTPGPRPVELTESTGSSAPGSSSTGSTGSTGSTSAPTTGSTVPSELVATLQQISSGGIRFELGRAELDAGARSLLDRLAPMLVGRGDLVLIVMGHTDSTGTPAINASLSVRRAQVVADYLVARGVPAGQLQVAGHGSDLPVADNGTDQGRQANRRSEVTAVQQGG